MHRHPTYRKDADKLDVFPAFHKVAGRKVLVIGGGTEAAAKVRLLAETSADVHVVALHIEPDMQAAIMLAGARHVAREFEASDLKGAALLFSAMEDEAKDRAVVEAARAAGIPANAVDRPELCDFYTGALVNRAPVAIAITSTGVGPVLTRHIRARIEAMLPRETGTLARLAESFRETVAQVMASGEDRRRFWARFFSGAVADRVYAGREDEARSHAQRLLNGQTDDAGFVWIVGAGPGAEDLLTLRAQRVLQEADIIVYDQLVPEAVVSMGRRDAERLCVGKAKGKHSHSQAEINAILVREGAAGRRVVRLKSGDPMIFGRAGEELAALREAGIAYEIVPGVTAALAAAASAEIPLTLRGVASSVVFATGHDQASETLPGWADMALKRTTVAVYMGRTVAAKVAAQLVAAGLSPQTPVAAIENAARSNEAVFAGALADLEAFGGRADVSGPVLIVIGAVVAEAAIATAKPLSPEISGQIAARSISVAA